MNIPETPNAATLVCGVGEIWRDGRTIFLRGWVIAPGAQVRSLVAELPHGAVPIEITQSPDRADAAFYTIHMPDGLQASLAVRALDAAGGTMLGLIDLRMPPLPEPDPEIPEREYSAAALNRFRDEIAERRLDLLELGSRQLGDTPSIWREYFGGAASYLGFDIHAGPGVDVAGDAHRLSDAVGRAAVDAIFSVAVLEHIAMPWIVAREVNRTLRMGGLVHVTTHQTWPVHETPNDFWRFSDASMKLLFGPMHGFETLACGMNGRLALSHVRPNPHYHALPFSTAYSSVFVLARKVAEVDDLPAEPGARELAELSRLYPPPAAPHPA